MEQRSISDEVDKLRKMLEDVVRACDFPSDASECLLRMIAAGELDIAFETLQDNISEYEQLRCSDELKQQLVTIRRRLDLLPPTNR
jgi:hypothetical protein